MRLLTCRLFVGMALLLGFCIPTVGCTVSSEVKAAMIPSVQQGLTTLMTGVISGLSAAVYPEGSGSSSSSSS